MDADKVPRRRSAKIDLVKVDPPPPEFHSRGIIIYVHIMIYYITYITAVQLECIGKRATIITIIYNLNDLFFFFKKKSIVSLSFYRIMYMTMVRVILTTRATNVCDILFIF